MDVNVNQYVGPIVGGDGANPGKVRTDKTSAAVVSQAHARMHEATSRGKVFGASNGTAGVAPGTVLSTTPPFALFNPLGSGVILSVLKVRIAYVSGTLGSGDLVYAFVPNQTAAPTGGTVLGVNDTRLTGTVGSGKAYQGSTLAATPTLLLPAATLTPVLATSVVSAAVIAKDDIDGEIEVSPGTVLVLQAVAAAGTTPLVMFGVTWEECPV